MRELPVALRWYLGAVYLACLALLAAQAHLLPGALAHRGVLPAAVVFVFLAYAGERAALPIQKGLNQTLTTAVHITSILLFPPPFPALIAFVAAVVAQAVHGQPPFYKRLFNICHPTLIVGLCGWIIAARASPFHLLQPGRVAANLPFLALLLVVYYVVDVGLLLGVLSFVRRQAPWIVWARMYRRTIFPELAASAIGILGAVAWKFDPILIALVVVPVVALHVTFRAIAQAEARALALERVLAAGKHMQIQQGEAALLQPVVEAALTIMDASTASAYLPDAAQPGWLTRAACAPAGAGHTAPPRVARSAIDGPSCEEGGAADGALLLPIEVQGMGATALLRLTGVPARTWRDVHDALAILATQTAIGLQNIGLHKRTLAHVSEDDLTGLLNHRYFQMRLDEEVARAQRNRQPLALVRIDLDDFDRINTAYGTRTGDATLTAVAAALRASVGSPGVVARYEGDEFAVMLPETGVDEAVDIARRACRDIAALRVIEGGRTITVSASAGVAALPLHGTRRDDLIRAADQAAHVAKHTGKGRVCRPEEPLAVCDLDPAVLAARLEHANMATVEALAAAVDAKDPYTRGHSQRVGTYAAAIAYALGLSAPDVARVRLAGLLHDVGKIGIPDAILTKPASLNGVEFRVIQRHAEIGERMLAAVPFLQEILPAVRHHHERWDGQGYPDGLAGAAIPRDAAILMVADAFDAMTSSRTYRPALSVAEARERLREGGGTQFDRCVVAALERAIDGGTLHVGPTLDALNMPAHDR